MKKKLTTLLILLLLTTTSSFAILEIKKITLEEALDFALKTNPQLQIMELDVEVSKNEIDVANRLKNPSIGTYQNIGDPAQGNPQQIGADYVVEVLKRGKRKAYAKSNSLVSLNNKEYRKHKLLADVKISYINLLLKKGNLKLTKDEKELSRDIYVDTLRKFDSNEATKADVIQAKIAYNRSIMYYNIARSEVVSAQNAFNTVMNTSDVDFDAQEDELSTDYENLLTISPLENSITFEKIKNFALENRNDLQAAKQKIESAQINLKVVKSQRIPDLELEGGYGYLTKGISDNGEFTSGAYAGVKLTNIPLIYNYAPEIKNAKLEIEKAQLNYRDIEIDVIRNVTDAWEKFVIAKENLNFYNKELLSNSKELLDESIKSLSKGEMDITSFLVSKKLYIELKLEYKQALCDYYTSFAELLGEMNAQYKDFGELI